MKRPHVALFSQSGREVYDIAKHFGRFPDYIITNQQDDSKIYSQLVQECPTSTKWLYLMPGLLPADVYNNIFSLYENPLITLHGWLKIVPPDICEKYTIYNGHPGLITLYPELKGKDPVEKVWNAMQENAHAYSLIGSVVHKVVAEVDAGEVFEVASCQNTVKSEEELYAVLRDRSFRAWTMFLEGKL